MKKDLSKNLKRFYGIGDLFFTMMTSVENYFFNFFLTNIVMFDLGIVTFIQTVTTVVDAAFSWAYGAIMNSIKPLKWGRYRSWLVVTPWLVPIVYMFKFMKIGSDSVAIVIIIAAGILSSVLWNFPYVANVALISVAAKTPNDRVSLSTSRGTYNRLAGIIFSYTGLPLALILGKVVGVDFQFAALAFILGTAMAISYFAHFKMFEGYEAIEETDDKKIAIAKKNKLGFVGTLKALVLNRPLLVLLVADIARWIVNFVASATAVYYFTYVLKNPGYLATYMIIIGIAAALGAFTCKFIANKFSARTTTIAYYLLMGALLVFAKTVHTNFMVVIVLLALAQYLYGSIYSLMPVLFADTVIYDEWKSKKNASGWIMGLNNVTLKIAIVFRGIILNTVLAVVGFSAAIDPATVSSEVMSGISSAFLLIPGIILIVGGLALAFGFNLTKEKVEEYSAEIASRS
ncbi:MFS transporter [Alkalibacter mobilis]|uniref:MFS transporter n=1 Tax=Alkalibacter mobilis TaxID=2787712 RepID=UPI00189E34D9|nr:MFS transporter [Alkalibacter mobilis]MBF7097453.1 MFS transporter [Alkalibacter mobilis]